MDALITSKDDSSSIKLSELGLQVYLFEESPVTVTHNTKSFEGRNGSIDYGGSHGSKTIKITSYFKAENITENELIQQSLNGILSSSESFYLTQLSSDDDMYDFERPGATDGELTDNENYPSHKRFLVTRTDNNAPEFQGKTGKLLSTWEFEFETTELPYGESVPENVDLNDMTIVPYDGTVVNSQLEQLFYFQIKPKVASTKGFSFTVGGHEWTYSGATVVGDVFELHGISNLKNDLSVNDETNYEFFELKPERQAANEFSCSISADIQLFNVKDLYA